jgi:hypothetical protein
MIAYGQKRFIIFPPDVYHEFKLYPCLHQFYRQIQTDIFDSELRDLLKRFNGVEVILSPGEVLYIPPYWFHSVVTMKTTISFNVWSQSEAYMILEDIYSAAIPFEEEWGRVKLMQALNYLVKQLVGSLLPIKDANSFMQESVYGRYKLFQDKLDTIVIEKDQWAVQEYCLRTHISDLLKPNEVTYVDEGISLIVALFRKIQSLLVLEINLANYIEHLTWRIVGTGDIALLPFYFHLCF